MLEVFFLIICLVLGWVFNYKIVFKAFILSIVLSMFFLITKHQGIVSSTLAYSFLLLFSGWLVYTFKSEQ